ncbi:MAG: hypothetical protein JKY89_01255 [Immundisolibacteraceae bacterium]|nr:hypothetical protein [Immundisolibacteraceae bacterium]
MNKHEYYCPICKSSNDMTFGKTIAENKTIFIVDFCKNCNFLSSSKHRDQILENEQNPLEKLKKNTTDRLDEMIKGGAAKKHFESPYLINTCIHMNFPNDACSLYSLSEKNLFLLIPEKFYLDQLDTKRIIGWNVSKILFDHAEEYINNHFKNLT